MVRPNYVKSHKEKWYDREIPVRVFAVPSPSLMFEIGEMMILLEKRTFNYHFCGALVGLFYCSFYYNWCRKRFPGTGIQLGGAVNTLTGAHPQRSSEPWTRSWGYGTTSNVQIKRKTTRRFEVPNNNERNTTDSFNGNDSQNSTENTNSSYSSDGSIDGIPQQNSQSPPTFTYGGERTDERDLTMSPPMNSNDLNIPSVQANNISHIVNPSTTKENNVALSTNSDQHILPNAITPPEPSYFSEANPPQVPFGLGGGTYISEESLSGEENNSSSYSSDGTYEDQENSDGTRNVQQRERGSSAEEPVIFEGPVITVEDLRRRRIERFS